jgi:alpha-galactosidase
MGPRTLYAKWAMALRATGRPIMLSICEWGRAHPWEWAGRIGHLWRTTPDIQPEWASLMAILDRQADLHPFAGPGHWNDPDMLEVGNGELTIAESRAHFALWAIMAAPLMAGNDLRAMPEDVRATLTAPEIIAIDQDPLGRQGRRVRTKDGSEIWLRDLAGDLFVVAALNRGSSAREIGVTLAELGISAGRVRVRDLWERTDRAVAAVEIVIDTPPHSATVLRLAPY